MVVERGSRGKWRKVGCLVLMVFPTNPFYPLGERVKGPLILPNTIENEGVWCLTEIQRGWGFPR